MRTIFPHPTLSETMHEAVLDAYRPRHPLLADEPCFRDRRAGTAASSGKGRPARQPRSRASPHWLRVKAPGSPEYQATRRLMRELQLNTVCEEAGCPNIGECWKQRHATVMILGAVCTRACAFCNVATGRPDRLDPHEPARVGEAVAALGLAHIVVTSVDRDDLEDGGAAQFARTIAAIRAAAPGDDDRGSDPGFPAQGRGAREGRRGAARRVQPQPRNRAASLRRGAAGCAIFPLAAAARPGQAARSGDVHQIRDHGRSRRGQGRNIAGDG